MLYFTIQNRLQAGTSKVSEAAGARWRFYRRISSDILGLWSNRLSIGGSTSGIFRANLDLQDFVAGAVFGEVGGWLDWFRALEMTFSYVTQITDDIDFVWQVQYLVRLGGDFTGSTHWKWSFHMWRKIIPDIHFAWQAQYLVRLEGDLTCSTHWKWAFICDADHWWHSFCVAGAVFGEVGGRLYLLHALEMSFHMWRRSLMTFILRGMRSIWWSWTVTLVAPRSSTGVVLCSTEWYRSSTL